MRILSNVIAALIVAMTLCTTQLAAASPFTNAIEVGQRDVNNYHKRDLFFQLEYKLGQNFYRTSWALLQFPTGIARGDYVFHGWTTATLADGRTTSELGNTVQNQDPGVSLSNPIILRAWYLENGVGHLDGVLIPNWTDNYSVCYLPDAPTSWITASEGLGLAPGPGSPHFLQRDVFAISNVKYHLMTLG